MRVNKATVELAEDLAQRLEQAAVSAASIHKKLMEALSPEQLVIAEQAAFYAANVSASLADSEDPDIREAMYRAEEASRALEGVQELLNKYAPLFPQER